MKKKLFSITREEVVKVTDKSRLGPITLLGSIKKYDKKRMVFEDIKIMSAHICTLIDTSATNLAISKEIANKVILEVNKRSSWQKTV